MALHGRQMGPQLGCWPESSIPLHIVSPWGLVGFLTVWWFQDSWTSKHGGWLPSKGKCGSFQAFLRSRPGTDSVISTSVISDVLSVTAGHRPVQIQGEGTKNGVNTQICGSLGTTEVTIYHSIVSNPLWFTSPHMQKTVTTLKVPKVSPHYCTRIELEVYHFII